MPLPFFDVDDFKVINAKFSLDMALEFFNANALTSTGVINISLKSIVRFYYYLNLSQNVLVLELKILIGWRNLRDDAWTKFDLVRS